MADALDSVIGQQVQPVEVLVIDDGSPDDVAAVTRRYTDRVRHVRQPNAGLAAARNTGIRLAAGEWVLFLDADDYLLPGMLTAYLAAAAANPGADVLHGGHHDVDPERRLLRTFSPKATPPDLFHALLSLGSLWPVHALLVRRRVLERYGGFDLHSPGVEDWDLWLRLAAAGCRFVSVPVEGAAYRMSPNSMSRNGSLMWRSACRVLRRHAGRHPDCRTCHRLIAEVPRGLRYNHLVGPAVSRIRSQWANAEYGAACSAILALLRWDPATGRSVTRAFVSHLGRSLLGTARREQP